MRAILDPAESTDIRKRDRGEDGGPDEMQNEAKKAAPARVVVEEDPDNPEGLTVLSVCWAVRVLHWSGCHAAAKCCGEVA